MDEKKESVIQEALKIVLEHSRSSVGISMGVGKCRLGLLHMEKNFAGTSQFLVVAPKLSIFESWKSEAVKWGLDWLLPHIRFSTYLSLDKQGLGYDIVYLDEMHSLKDSNRGYLSSFKGGIVGLTGTPPRYEHSEKGMMVRDFCPVVFTYDTDSAVQDEILNDYRIIIHSLQLSTKKDLWIKTKTGGWMTSEQQNYFYWTKRIEESRSKREQQIMQVLRMKALMNFKTKIDYAKDLFDNIDTECIVFADSQNEADLYCTHSYHSNNPSSEENLELFKSKKIRKLSCVLQLNEGVNLPVREIIVKHSYGNNRKFAQRLGRCLRLNPDETAVIHILMYENTVDSKWVTSALEDFSEDKITYKSNKIISI